jgi:predicted dinucleotide-binding enzyme
MKIAVIGSGNVGGTLGRRWAQAGHTVIFSSRTPDSEAMRKLLAASGATASTASPLDAAAAADVILLASPWKATKDMLAAAGDLKGKVLIDVQNPLLPDLSGLEIGTTTSAAETIAGWAPGARVVKAFNTIGTSVMDNPRFGDEKAVLFYCGDNADAKAQVHTLAADLGFDPQDAGPLTQARILEPFALLWISLAFTRGFGTRFAFQILRRS